MAKLIFINLDGLQDIMDIFPGGGCNDKSMEIWNELTDGPVPEKALDFIGGLVRKGKELEFDANLKAKQDEIVAKRNEAEAVAAKEKVQRIEQICALQKAEDLEAVCAGLKALCHDLGYF